MNLVWFRSDLRVRDHLPLLRAAEEGAYAGVFFWPRGPMGVHRHRFLVESLLDLRESLRELDSELYVYPREAMGLLRDWPGRVYYGHFPGTWEADEDRCLSGGIWSDTLVEFDPAQLPPIFTEFRKSVEGRIHPRDPLGIPRPSKGKVSGLPPGLTLEPSEPGFWRGGHRAGYQRLIEYFWDTDAVATYKQTRNGMLRPLDSTRLSPWLALGCLSPREVYAELQDYERDRIKNDSTYWVYFELLWRDYFHFLTRQQGAALFRLGGIQQTAFPWSKDLVAFERWATGETGFDIVDASMKELVATGWMSNRGRQIVASFLTKNLGIDWRWGARFFEKHLMDYDPASNYGNWQYAAGVGTDPREHRVFNPDKQAKDYDSDGSYRRHWLGKQKRPGRMVDFHQSAEAIRRARGL